MSSSERWQLESTTGVHGIPPFSKIVPGNAHSLDHAIELILYMGIVVDDYLVLASEFLGSGGP
jgi:hypothetical protein